MLNGVLLKNAGSTLNYMNRKMPVAAAKPKQFAPVKKPTPQELAKNIDEIMPEKIKNMKIYKFIRPMLEFKPCFSEAGGGCN